jgi:hypothetical protein
VAAAAKVSIRVRDMGVLQGMGFRYPLVGGTREKVQGRSLDSVGVSKINPEHRKTQAKKMRRPGLAGPSCTSGTQNRAIRDTIKTRGTHNTLPKQPTTTSNRCAYVRRHLITVAASGAGSKPATERAMTIAIARDDGMTATR